MKRVIVDYKKLTPEILRVLVEKYPDGYGLKDVIKFVNAKGKYVDALEIKIEDCTYLVKISDELADTMEDFDEEENLPLDDTFSDIDSISDDID